MYSSSIQLPPLLSLITGSKPEPSHTTYSNGNHISTTTTTTTTTYSNPSEKSISHLSQPNLSKISPDINGKHVSILPKVTSTSSPTNLSNPPRFVQPYPTGSSSSPPPNSTGTRYYPYPHTSPNGHSSYEEHAGKILDEKRRRNATASAKFRDRRKQREKDALERCQILEEKVKDLEQGNPFTTQLSELNTELHQVRSEKQNALDKVSMLENEIAWLRKLFISKGEHLPTYSQGTGNHSLTENLDLSR